MTTGAELPYAAVQALARDSLVAYCILMDPSYEPSPHAKAIVEHLEALERGEIRRLMIFMPPRHGKTYHVSERFPAWYLGRHPDRRVILASYASELAETNSRVVRDLVADERNPFPVRLNPDSKSVGRWETTAGGSLLAAGVGSGMTGFGGHLLDIDDPFSGPEQADSATYRDRAWTWYQAVARTRLQAGALELLCNTRWSEDDIAGRILNSPQQSSWTVLSLAAYAEADDPLGRSEGEALWVSENAPPIPDVAAGEMSSRTFAALYQQRPVPEAGGVFQATWFYPQPKGQGRRYSRKQLEEAKTNPRWSVVQAIDTGGKPGVGHDPTAIATWGWDGISCYLLDYWSAQVEYTRVRDKIASPAGLYWQYRPRMVYIEDATWAQPLISDLRSLGVRVYPVPARGSKWTRADAVAPLFEGGNVVLPQSAPWLEAWLTEMLAFPNAPHDEAVDTTSLALSQIQGQPQRKHYVRMTDKGVTDRTLRIDQIRTRLRGARHAG